MGHRLFKTIMLSQTGKRSALKAHRDELKEIEQEIARYKANLRRSAMRKKKKQTAAKSITSVFIDTKPDIPQATASLTSPARSKKNTQRFAYASHQPCHSTSITSFYNF